MQTWTPTTRHKSSFLNFVCIDQHTALSTAYSTNTRPLFTASLQTSSPITLIAKTFHCQTFPFANLFMDHVIWKRFFRRSIRQPPVAISQIQEFVETSIVLKKDKNNELGISIIGGSDTYLVSTNTLLKRVFLFNAQYVAILSNWKFQCFQFKLDTCSRWFVWTKSFEYSSHIIRYRMISSSS